MKVSGFGPERARIMLVGEAPGEDEDRAGRPFVGKAGQKLRQHLMEEGIDPLDCFFTNICQIRPPGNQLDKFFLDGGIPTEPILEGIGALIEEIRRVQPNIIVACGNYALWALTRKAKWVDYQKDGKRIRGFTGIQTWRGSLLPCTLVEGFKVLPTYHPSYILRSMEDHGTFKSDLAKAKEESVSPILERPKKSIIVLDQNPRVLSHFEDANGRGYYETWADAPGLDTKLTPIWEPIWTTREEVRECLLGLPPAEEVDTSTAPLQLLTVDIEFAGKTLLCVGVTNRRDTAYVIPTRTAQDFAYVESILMSHVGINAQNSMFDGSVLEWHFGWEIMSRIKFDTMFAAHSAEIELPKGLDYLASIHTSMPYWKDMVDWKAVKKGQQSLDMLYAYNGIDVWTQHEIAEVQIRDQLDDPAVRRTFDFEMALLLPLWNMSKRGIKIDKDLIEASRQQLDGEMARLGMELLLMAGRPINPRPSNDCTWFLYEKMGLPVTKKTKTEKLSTDDKTLASYAIRAPTEEQRRAVMLVRQYRTAASLVSKFYDITLDDDGRMRGHYDPTRTVTGRLASRKFAPTDSGSNNQNFPKAKPVRRSFVADRGKIFFYADLERAESLVVAELTGDPRMLADHAPGMDAHKSLAAAIYNVAPEEVTEEQRYMAKKARHAGNYMQGALTFMNNFNQDAHKTGLSVTFKEASELIELYRRLHPFLKSWWDDTKKEMWRTRTLYNLLGRKRVFYGHIDRCVPEGVAHVPQSTVGDTLNVGFLNMEGIASPYLEHIGEWHRYELIGPELREYGLECLMQIHDAVAGQVWEKDADRALPLIRRAMEIPLRNPRTYEWFTIPVEILADLDPERVALGKSNWGDVSAVKFS